MEEEDKNTVLMADDDADDCFLAKEAFLESGAKAIFFCVEDGEVLIDYLSKHSHPEIKGLPKLILLDLNMPRKDGRLALREIKAEPTLRDIPIVIFTTSEEEKDIVFAMKTGADLFITKPTNYDDWVEIMKSLAERWLR
jgi:CheY-like chemotaxis protein